MRAPSAERAGRSVKKGSVQLKYLKILYTMYPAIGLLSEYRLAKQIVNKYGCRRILDIGCGRGNLLRVLEKGGAEVDLYVGVDINLFPFPSTWRGQFVVCDVRRLPVATSRFDCVVFVNSIFYISLGVLKDMEPPRRVFVVIDIDPKYPHIRLVDLLESGLRGMRLTKKRLLEWLTKNGFTVVEHGGNATYYIVFSRTVQADGSPADEGLTAGKPS